MTVIGFGRVRNSESAACLNAPPSMIEIIPVFPRGNGEYPGGIDCAGVILNWFLGQAVDPNAQY
jgi:hypothetical protein